MGKFGSYEYRNQPGFDMKMFQEAGQAIPMKTLVIYCFGPRAVEIPQAVAEHFVDEVYPGEIITDENGIRAATPCGSNAFRRDTQASPKSLRRVFNSSLLMVHQMSSVALPWLRTKCRASVDWLSASKSVQSITTTISRRSPTTSRTQAANRSQGATPAWLSNRSTCLIPVFGKMLRAYASAWPTSETASAADVMTPSAPFAEERTRSSCKSLANIRLKTS